MTETITPIVYKLLIAITEGNGRHIVILVYLRACKRC